MTGLDGLGGEDSGDEELSRSQGLFSIPSIEGAWTEGDASRVGDRLAFSWGVTGGMMTMGIW